MDRPRMRPRFEIELPVPQGLVWDAIEEALHDDDVRCTGWVQESAAELHVLRDDEHFFSPMLCLSAESLNNDAGDNGTRLRGRFSPHPHVWMLFMALYFLCGAIVTAGTMFGVSQWMMGASPWALWFAPLGLALAGFIYGAAFIGQGLGAEQMHWLWSVVDDARDRLDR